MSRITIQNIIDNNSTRDAQRILRKVIEAMAAGQRTDIIQMIVNAAKQSCLINSDAPASKKIASVTFNQILDRMTTDALVCVINMELMEGEGAGFEQMRIEFQEASHDTSDYQAWPFYVVLRDYHDHTTDITDWLDVTPTAKPAPAVTQDDDDGFDEELLSIANMAANKATRGRVADIKSLIVEVEELRKRPTQAAPLPVAASGDIPHGYPVRENAQAVFGIVDKLLDFEITTYSWDDVNPLVPQVMQHFKFDVDALADLLWAREKNKNAWLVGHTGTGKSTLVEQVCAYTRTMFQRVNFDSDITRLEFVGKVDVSVDDEGNQVTSFTDGILPKAMQMPCVLMLDEADAIRGDIAYVLQPVLEGKSLRLLEDGGRMVHPHPEFTIVATANTVGAGDSTGMYSAAVKMQSTAAMNRYNVFIHVDYMAVDDEMAMIEKIVPEMGNQLKQSLGSFITHYRHAIKIGEVTKPISPRNTITIAQYAVDFEQRLGAYAAFKRALERNLFNAMDEGERAIAVGIADRTQA